MYDYPEIIWNACRRVQFLWKVKYYGGNSQDKGNLNHVRKVTFISGALMLIKRSVFEKIGLLPEVYFFGVEDLEFCRKATKNKFKLYYIPTLIAWHKAGKSRKKAEFELRYNAYLSYLIFVKRNYPYIIYKLLFLLIGIAIKLNLIKEITGDKKLAIELALKDSKVKGRIDFSDLIQYNQIWKGYKINCVNFLE